jgi:RES domain-containing protein
MVAYRIADARHPIYDGGGAMLCGGRWNSAGRRVIYAAETYAGAMLEVLVHANLSLPPRHHQVVRIAIPDEVEVETVSGADLPGWDGEDVTVARRFGDGWLRKGRSAVLRVPSVVTGGREYNVLINPAHRQAGLIEASVPEVVRWDVRLFAGGAGAEESSGD